MLPATDWDKLILATYQAPMETPAWSSLIAAIHQHFGKRAFSLIFRKPGEDNGHGMVHVGGTEYWYQRYNSHFYRLDPFVDLPQGKAITLSDFLGRTALEATPYFRDYMQSIKLHDVLGFDTVSNRGTLLWLRICQFTDEAPFSAADHALLERLAPHILLAADISGQMHEASREKELFLNHYESINLGIFTLDQDLRVIEANQTASAIIRRHGGLCERYSLLEMPRTMARINTDIADALNSTPGEANPFSRYLGIRHSDGNMVSFGIQALTGSERLYSAEARCLVKIFEPAQPVSLSPQLLIDLYGLTRTESRVAALLAEGHSSESLAESLDISMNTLRTHIRALLKKTGATGKEDLVRILIRSLVLKV